MQFPSHHPPGPGRLPTGSRGFLMQRGNWFVQVQFSRSETIVAGPQIDFFLDGKDLARSHCKACFELEGLGFERNVDPRTSLQKTAKIRCTKSGKCPALMATASE